MLHILAKEITSFFIGKNILQSEYREVCEYSLQKRLSTYFSIMILLFICNFKCSLIETSFFIFPLLLLRKRTGGYHAETPLKCLFCTVGITYVSIYFLLPLALKINLLSLLCIYCICVCLLLIFSPLNNPNIQMTKQEIAATKQKIYKILFIVTAILIIVQTLGCMKLVCLVMLAVFNATMSLLFGKLIQQEVKSV